jgi:hypothetical protein
MQNVRRMSADALPAELLPLLALLDRIFPLVHRNNLVRLLRGGPSPSVHLQHNGWISSMQLAGLARMQANLPGQISIQALGENSILIVVEHVIAGVPLPEPATRTAITIPAFLYEPYPKGGEYAGAD